MKEKLDKKEQHKQYTLFTIYRSNIVGKTNQFKHNSLFINLFCLQYYLSQCASKVSHSSTMTPKFLTLGKAVYCYRPR